MPQRLRVFISSPTDVHDERLRAELLIDKLSQDYSRFFAIESYRWEHEAMIASKHFQDAIEPPSAFDIVILILWSRLGTPLPERTMIREYRGIDGRAPVTGTEWEYEEALKAALEKGAPDLLAFRKISPAAIDPRDPKAQARSISQLAALNEFWTRHFEHRGLFLSACDTYRTLDQFSLRLEESLQKLVERRIRTLSTRTEPIWLSDPFRGLETYEFEHAPIFFGRDALVIKATEQLVANARTGHAFLLVSGASGSGKSSLVKAAIVPRLMKPQRFSEFAFLRRVIFRPASDGDDIVAGLAQALTRTSSEEGVGLSELLGPGQNVDMLAAHLNNSLDNPGYVFDYALARLAESARKSGHLLEFETAKLILVIDQLEEIFTSLSVGSEARRRFIRLLAGLSRSGAVWVIGTLRADFWHRAAELPELIVLAEGQGRIDIAAPSLAELGEIIRKPSAAAGLEFETHVDSGLGLDLVLTEDASAAPGALPLLSFVLDKLFETRSGHILTFASYEVLGGLKGAIANRADAVLAEVSEAGQLALPRVLRSLLTTGQNAEGIVTARVAPLRQFKEGSAERELVDALLRARLLVSDTGDGAGSGSFIRIAHEALLTQWSHARDWIDERRADFPLESRLEVDAEWWSNATHEDRSSLLLPAGLRLSEAEDLLRRRCRELAETIVQFIRASSCAEDERQATERRRTAAEESLRREKIRALELIATTQINLLARVAESEYLRGNLDTALKLCVHAARRELDLQQPTSSSSRVTGILASLVCQAGSHLRLRGHSGAVNSAIFSPDDCRILTASSDNSACIWDAISGEAVAILRGHGHFVLSAAYSPDGSRIATASWDNTARIWNSKAREKLNEFWHSGDIWVTTSEELAILRGHDKFVQSASFSSDGLRVVTASWDGTARVWDATSGRQIAMLRGHEAPVFSAAFSPDGLSIVTASEDKSARIWDATTYHQRAILRGHEGAVNFAAFSPDCARIVTASEDHTCCIWQTDTCKQIASLRGHESSVRSAIFNSDGSRVVTASWDNTARIWDCASFQEIAVLRRHNNSVQWAAFSTNGARVVTASWDHTACASDVHVAAMSTRDVVGEVCAQLRSRGISTMTRAEMRLAGYDDDFVEVDVCRD